MSRRSVLSFGITASALVLAGCAAPRRPAAIAVSSEIIRYGTDPLHQAALRVPLEPSPRPVVVLVHGGYWRSGFTRVSMDPLALSLNNLGFATWNLDYRTIDDPGGGWPGTALDVQMGIDHLPSIAAAKNLDLERAVFLGHSAGAQLAMIAGARGTSDGSPAPPVVPRGLVSLSGVLDLVSASSEGPAFDPLAENVRAFLGGGPGDRPDTYRAASPIAQVPYGIATLVLHGEDDGVVPVRQSRDFAAAASAAGDDGTRLVEVESADHFNVINTNKSWWTEVLDWLPTIVGEPFG